MILFQDDIDHEKQLQLVKEQLKGELFALRKELKEQIEEHALNQFLRSSFFAHALNLSSHNLTFNFCPFKFVRKSLLY